MISRTEKKRKNWWLRPAVVIILLALTGIIWKFDAIPSPRDWFVDDTAYSDKIAVASRRYGIDPELVRALIFRESRFNPNARGSCGEIGLMQILPSGAAAEWARIYKWQRPGESELFDIDLNLDIGCWYLARGLKRWKNHRQCVELALAQYNAGERRAKAWAGGDPKKDVLDKITLSSTKLYVKNIMKRYRKYASRREAGAAKR